MTTTPPRPTLDETLARIDAVLDEPVPTPCPLDGEPLQGFTSELGKPTVYVHRDGGQHPDRLSQLLQPTEAHAAAVRAVHDAVSDAVHRGLLARAIGWFRR